MVMSPPVRNAWGNSSWRNLSSSAKAIFAAVIASPALASCLLIRFALTIYYEHNPNRSADACQDRYRNFPLAAGPAARTARHDSGIDAESAGGAQQPVGGADRRAAWRAQSDRRGWQRPRRRHRGQWQRVLRRPRP